MFITYVYSEESVHEVFAADLATAMKSYTTIMTAGLQYSGMNFSDSTRLQIYLRYLSLNHSDRPRCGMNCFDSQYPPAIALPS